MENIFHLFFNNKEIQIILEDIQQTLTMKQFRVNLT